MKKYICCLVFFTVFQMNKAKSEYEELLYFGSGITIEKKGTKWLIVKTEENSPFRRAYKGNFDGIGGQLLNIKHNTEQFIFKPNKKTPAEDIYAFLTGIKGTEITLAVKDPATKRTIRIKYTLGYYNGINYSSEAEINYLTYSMAPKKSAPKVEVFDIDKDGIEDNSDSCKLEAGETWNTSCPVVLNTGYRDAVYR